MVPVAPPLGPELSNDMRPSVVFKLPLIGLPAADPMNEPSGSILVSIGPFRSQTRPVPRHVPASWLVVGVGDMPAACFDVSLAHAPSPSVNAARARTPSTTDRCCLMSALLCRRLKSIVRAHAAGMEPIPEESPSPISQWKVLVARPWPPFRYARRTGLSRDFASCSS